MKPSADRTMPAMSYFLNGVQELCYVLEEDALVEAITLMVMKSYSQVIVLHSRAREVREKGVVGVVTWASIGGRLTKKSFSVETAKVRDCMLSREKIKFCTGDELIKDVAERMEETEFALVVDDKQVVRRLVTYYDMAALYLETVKPFSVIESIELSIRRLLAPLSADELRAAARSEERARMIGSSADLEFAEYRQLLSEHWDRLDTRLSRKSVLASLERVNAIRNAVMHFRPEGVSREDSEFLEQVRNLLDNG